LHRGGHLPVAHRGHRLILPLEAFLTWNVAAAKWRAGLLHSFHAGARCQSQMTFLRIVIPLQRFV
jgi:hypothetical protein